MLFMAVADVLTWVQTVCNGGVLVAQLVQMGMMISLMNNISNGAWLLRQARNFCIEFDQIIVQYSDKVYGYFTEIVGGTLITPEIIDGLMSRIYIVVGMFIFFKIMIVAMKYMINPEQFTDDKLGAQTMVKRIILGSIIILFIPTIFSVANKLQASIIGERVIEKIILPEDLYKTLIKSRTPGRDLSMLVFNGFFQWNEAIDQDSVKNVYNSYNKVKVYNDLTLFNKSFINEEKNDQYVINYIPIISTLATGYVLFMLIKYAMEVAFRSFKLMLLQIMSPFVIVNYMLDTQQEETMKKWVNSTISTYLMIFIRVMTIWLATLMAYFLNEGVNGESVLNTPDPLLKSLIVLAIFAFLKDLPKTISEIFGYNLQENETITGIMNTGVNVLKGFAMGKVSKDITSGVRTAGMVANGFSAAGGAAGIGVGIANTNTANKGLKELKTSNGNSLGFNSVSSMQSSNAQSSRTQQDQERERDRLLKLKEQGVTQISSGMATIGSAENSVTSTLGSVTASYMGQTVLGPVAQTVSASSHGAQIGSVNPAYSIRNDNTTDVKAENTYKITNDNNFKIEETAYQEAINDMNKNNFSSNNSVSVYENKTIESMVTPNEDRGRYTTARQDRLNETPIQQLVNDSAHVHDQLNTDELINRIENSAFNTLSDAAFRAYQEKHGVYEDPNKNNKPE